MPGGHRDVQKKNARIHSKIIRKIGPVGFEPTTSPTPKERATPAPRPDLANVENQNDGSKLCRDPRPAPICLGAALPLRHGPILRTSKNKMPGSNFVVTRDLSDQTMI